MDEVLLLAHRWRRRGAVAWGRRFGGRRRRRAAPDGWRAAGERAARRPRWMLRSGRRAP